MRQGGYISGAATNTSPCGTTGNTDHTPCRPGMTKYCFSITDKKSTIDSADTSLVTDKVGGNHNTTGKHTQAYYN